MPPSESPPHICPIYIAPYRRYRPGTSEFSLNLDARTTLPVLFADAKGGELLSLFSTASFQGPAGRFYSGKAALPLLNTIRSSGASGRVIVRNDASAELKTHFQRFSERLHGGDLVSHLSIYQLVVNTDHGHMSSSSLHLDFSFTRSVHLTTLSSARG